MKDLMEIRLETKAVIAGSNLPKQLTKTLGNLLNMLEQPIEKIVNSLVEKFIEENKSIKK